MYSIVLNCGSLFNSNKKPSGLGGTARHQHIGVGYVKETRIFYLLLCFLLVDLLSWRECGEKNKVSSGLIPFHGHTANLAKMALISMEDLAELDDEQLDDDMTDNAQPADEEESERLLTHWQAVGRTHQVTIPREMTGPIVEMTRRNQEQQPVPFITISTHEKLGEVVYEERVYPAGKWACITVGEKLYEQSISMGFMKLMRFICKENSAGGYLGMTVPVVNGITMLEDGRGFESEVLTAYYLPEEFQENPPQPADPDITIVHRDSVRVITRVFYGTTTEETISRQISLLWELLGASDDIHQDQYMVAVYENPGVPSRRNEIWFICRNP